MSSKDIKWTLTDVLFLSSQAAFCVCTMFFDNKYIEQFTLIMLTVLFFELQNLKKDK
jgi:hypothetical protein